MEKVLSKIFWILVLFSAIGLPAILADYFGNHISIGKAIIDVFSFLGIYIGGGVLVCAPFYFLSDQMQYAAENRNSKAFKIIEGVNVISILFLLAIALIYFIPNGLHGIRAFYREYIWWFLGSVAAAAFSIYWWWLKRDKQLIKKDKNGSGY